MGRSNNPDNHKELLEKLLLLRLYSLGASQSQIAQFLGKSKTWVNDLVKVLPPRGKNGSGE